VIARRGEMPADGGIGARDGLACDHCGLPVPRGLVDADADRQFCCGGCRAVWESLHACGLGAYYDLRRREGGRGNTPSAARSLAHLDGPEFLDRHARREAPDLLSIEMRLDGVRCGACVWLLEALPRLEPGLVSLRVNLGRSTVRIEWAPLRTRLSTIAERLAALGYEVAPLGDPATRERERRVDRRWFARIGIAGAVAGNAMAIAFALYGGMFTGMDPTLATFLHWTSVGLAAVAVFGPGRLFLANATLAVRTRTPHVDLPIAAALLAGLAGGAVATILGEGGIYAESVCMLVFLLLVGRFVQHRQQRRARHEVELLCALVPSTARRVVTSEGDDAVETVATEALEIGDLVEVPAGEAVPADGALLVGDRPAWFDLSILTGESRPVSVVDGDVVYAGSRPTDRPVRVRVAARGDDTRAAGIARLVEEAASRRAPVVAFANRIGAWFLLAVLLLAAATTALWWHAGPAIALERAVAVLVVTCPCALGLATPLAMTASLAKAARRGLLVRGGDVLERLARPGTIVLDKTGTLTLGRTEVVRVEGDEEAVSIAAALERTSVHPVARALVAHADRRGDEFGAAAEVRERIGLGVVGRVGGRRVAVGRRALLVEEGVGVEAARAWDLHAGALERRGLSPVWIAVDGVVRAIAGIGDPLRPGAAALVTRLQATGWRTRLLSGDVAAIAEAVGGAAGIDRESCRGGATPESKADEVADPRLARPVVMVGDGVNDLAAMAAADVGVAVRDGSASALATADVCLPRGGLEPLLGLLEGARRTLRTIHVNFAISLAYNLAGGTLAVLGLVNPLVAAVIMPLSGLTVTAVALRMPRFRIDETPERSSSSRREDAGPADAGAANVRLDDGSPQRIAAWN
jgi:Cu2+-exporting ATPase